MQEQLVREEGEDQCTMFEDPVYKARRCCRSPWADDMGYIPQVSCPGSLDILPVKMTTGDPKAQ